MTSLVEAVTSLASARTLDEVMAVVRQSARTLVRADGVTFVLREEGQCYYAEEDAIAPLWKGKRFPLESCISGWTMLNRQVAVIRNIYKDPRIPQEAYRPTFVKSLAMVPVHRQDPMAAIGAYWARAHTATRKECAILQALANAAGLALHNVELNTHLQRALSGEREARERAEAANKLKDEFLSTLSHELRTPLHVIHNWVWQLKRGNPSPAIEKGLEVIERNASLQSRLIDDLLTVSRATTGQLKLANQLVDLKAICAALMEELQPMSHAKGIRMTAEYEGPSYVWGDLGRLRQILWNVLNNAVKFSPSNGEVAIRTRRGSRHVCVVIQDSGIGIAPEFMPFIFDRFRQADPSFTRSYGGLGLGLTIVKELVRLHGGDARAESRGPNQGTTVTLEFPVPVVLDEAPAKVPQRTALDVATAKLDGVTVLIVDDEVDVLATLREILRYHGAHVLAASSADEALQLLETHRPNVLVSDLAMPNKDGLTLLRAVRALPHPAGAIPAAALSAYQASEHASDAVAAGYQLFIEKPVAPLDLVGQIAQLASRSLQ